MTGVQFTPATVVAAFSPLLLLLGPVGKSGSTAAIIEDVTADVVIAAFVVRVGVAVVSVSC